MKKFPRKVTEKLTARQKWYEALKDKQGYTKPGSRNPRKS